MTERVIALVALHAHAIQVREQGAQIAVREW
jgi:hypothetical protein